MNKNISSRGKHKFHGRLLAALPGIFALLVCVFVMSPGAASASDAAASALSFSPASVAVTNGASFTVAPTINTGGNTVSIVSLKMTFDPSKLTLTNISVPAAYSSSTPFWSSETAGFNPNDTSTNGAAAFATYISNANSSGTINFDISVGTAYTSISGTFAIANLTFTAKAVGSPQIAFTSASNDYADDVDGGAAVISRDPAAVTISAAAPSTYNVGGTITGLNGNISLINGNQIVATSLSSFTFPNPLAYGSSYNVSVNIQPVGQTCTVTNGTGTISGVSVSNVNVTCANNAVSDTTPPVISAGSPSGTLAAGTNQATVSVTTNENATCRSWRNAACGLAGGVRPAHR